MEPRLLVISNNALSTTSNNGKTLESFLLNFNKKNVSQLYFRNEQPNSMICSNYFCITERDIIENLLLTKKHKNAKASENSTITKNKKITIKKSFFSIIVRELLWLIGPWKSLELKQWLIEFNPTHILFCAGDSLFAYRIAYYVLGLTGAKFIVFYTDDYFFRYRSKNIIRKIYNFLIQNNIKKAINNCDLLLTISEYMREKYKETFNKDSVVVANMPDFPTKVQDMHIFNKNAIQLIYAGSLYYSRDEMLLEIGRALDLINEKFNTNHILNIYTNSSIKENVKIPKSIVLNQPVNKEELNIIYQNSDILVFVESFEKIFIEKTKYSFSTKIPEYLSYQKCVLCYGPDTVGSVKYLNNVAYCITNSTDLYFKLINLLNNELLCNQIGEKCYKKYLDYKEKTNPLKIYTIICNL